MIISKTPFRLSFFGGGTDYNSWYEKNKGLIIGTSFSQYNYISIRKLSPFFDHKSRIVYSKSETVNDNSQIEHPAVRNCLKFMDINEGVEVHYDGDLPARSGIGSSSSFTAGFLMALHAHKGLMISKRQLAEQAIYVEQVLNAENVGIQDQILTSYGGLNVIEMGPGSSFNVNPLILPKEYKKQLESHIMLAFSGLTRNASETASAQITKISNGDLDKQMSEIYGIAVEALELFKINADFKSIGHLFGKTWEIKRTLTKDITNTQINEAYSIAIKNGAYGGRLLGAGGGGFLMFFAPPEMHKKIKDALINRIKVWVPFEFEDRGAHIILANQ